MRIRDSEMKIKNSGERLINSREGNKEQAKVSTNIMRCQGRFMKGAEEK
jgi:hypothetical protein